MLGTDRSRPRRERAVLVEHRLRQIAAPGAAVY
jgi:hypothetical protein